MQPKDLFNLSRALISIFSVSVWHQQINETISNGTLDANNCRLMSPLFFTILFIHFIYNTASFFYLKREFVLWYSLVNILVGAFIVMSLKPNQWFYSLNGQIATSCIIITMSLGDLLCCCCVDNLGSYRVVIKCFII